MCRIDGLRSDDDTKYSENCMFTLRGNGQNDCKRQISEISKCENKNKTEIMIRCWKQYLAVCHKHKLALICLQFFLLLNDENEWENCSQGFLLFFFFLRFSSRWIVVVYGEKQSKLLIGNLIWMVFFPICHKVIRVKRRLGDKVARKCKKFFFWRQLRRPPCNRHFSSVNRAKLKKKKKQFQLKPSMWVFRNEKVISSDLFNTISGGHEIELHPTAVHTCPRWMY